jgi:hypothetical protein
LVKETVADSLGEGATLPEVTLLLLLDTLLY